MSPILGKRVNCVKTRVLSEGKIDSVREKRASREWREGFD